MTSIAVIVATYGEESWAQLARSYAAESVSAQRVLPDELHVVHEPDARLHEARNLGAAKASAEWLCFLDADDRLDPFYIAAMRAAIAAGDGQRLLTPAVERDGIVGLLEPRRSIWHGNWLVIGTLIRRDLFEACEGFWDERGWEDWSLWIRAIELGARVVPVIGALYQVGPGQSRNVVERPYALGMEIRERNRRWLANRLANPSALDDATVQDRDGLALERAR